MITPINFLEEEVSFFNSSSYQPQFQYNWDQNSIDDWLIKSPLYKDLVQAILIQNYDLITQNAQDLFRVPWSAMILKKAHQILQTPPETVQVSSLELKKKYQEAVEYFQLDYDIEVIDQAGFLGRPQPRKKRILISRYADSYYFSAADSARHEFTHVIRFENGFMNNIKKSHYYLSTEEGLATYNQDFWQKNPTSARFQHAAEFAVTEITRKGSLREAVNYLISLGFPPKLAWQRAARHKFGFIDTSKPGNIMKPAMYFAYSQQIATLKDSERLRLFVGKISIEDLSLFPEYKGKWDEQILKEFFFGV